MYRFFQYKNNGKVQIGKATFKKGTIARFDAGLVFYEITLNKQRGVLVEATENDWNNASEAQRLDFSVQTEKTENKRRKKEKTEDNSNDSIQE